jgi:hypothetical protein
VGTIVILSERIVILSEAKDLKQNLKSVVETAREQVAELIGAPSRDVIFTSCATESNPSADGPTWPRR